MTRHSHIFAPLGTNVSKKNYKIVTANDSDKDKKDEISDATDENTKKKNWEYPILVSKFITHIH